MAEVAGELTRLFVLHSAGGLDARQFAAAKAALLRVGAGAGADAAPRRSAACYKGAGASTVFVHPPSGGAALPVDVAADATVGGLRDAIAGAGGGAFARDRLCHIGADLSDDKVLLADLGIGAQAEVHAASAAGVWSRERKGDGMEILSSGAAQGHGTVLAEESGARQWSCRVDGVRKGQSFGLGVVDGAKVTLQGPWDNRGVMGIDGVPGVTIYGDGVVSCRMQTGAATTCQPRNASKCGKLGIRYDVGGFCPLTDGDVVTVALGDDARAPAIKVNGQACGEIDTFLDKAFEQSHREHVAARSFPPPERLRFFFSCDKNLVSQADWEETEDPAKRVSATLV